MLASGAAVMWRESVCKLTLFRDRSSRSTAAHLRVWPILSTVAKGIAIGGGADCY
jgi:hypothetical protein